MHWKAWFYTRFAYPLEIENVVNTNGLQVFDQTTLPEHTIHRAHSCRYYPQNQHIVWWMVLSQLLSKRKADDIASIIQWWRWLLTLHIYDGDGFLWTRLVTAAIDLIDMVAIYSGRLCWVPLHKLIYIWYSVSDIRSLSTIDWSKFDVHIYILYKLAFLNCVCVCMWWVAHKVEYVDDWHWQGWNKSLSSSKVTLKQIRHTYIAWLTNTKREMIHADLYPTVSKGLSVWSSSNIKAFCRTKEGGLYIGIALNDNALLEYIGNKKKKKYLYTYWFFFCDYIWFFFIYLFFWVWWMNEEDESEGGKKIALFYIKYITH